MKRTEQAARRNKATHHQPRYDVMRVACPLGAIGNVTSRELRSRRRAAKALFCASRTTTAIEKRVRFCWWDRFRSTVTNASNCCCARASKRPFLIPFQPICSTVRTSWPAIWRASRRLTHSSRRTRMSRRLRRRFARRFEYGHNLLSTHSGKALQEIFDSLSGLKSIPQVSHRNASACETRLAAHDFRIRDNYAALHGGILTP
jgi:hypothetical protein